jgi:hypothetical protein
MRELAIPMKVSAFMFVFLTTTAAQASNDWTCFATCTQFMRGAYGSQPVEIYVQHFKVGGISEKSRTAAFNKLKKTCKDLTAEDLSFSVDLQLRTIEFGGRTLIHESTISATEGNSCISSTKKD